MGRRAAVAGLLVAALWCAVPSPGAARASATGCESAVAATARSPVTLLCGAMLLAAPAGWQPREVGHTMRISPACCTPAMTVWIGAEPATASIRDLRRLAGRGRLVAFPAGLAVLATSVHGHEARAEAWFGHRSTAYTVRATATTAYLAKHPTVFRDLLRRVVFDDDAYARAGVVEYAGWKVRLGSGGSRPLVAEVHWLTLAAAGPQWQAVLLLRNQGERSLRVDRVDALLSPSRTVTAATAENVLRAASYSPDNAERERRPSPLLLAPHATWRGLISGGMVPAAGRFASVRLEYTVAGRTATYAFPARERPSAATGQDDDYPLLDASTSDVAPAKPVTTWLTVSRLARTARTARITVEVPAGYAAALDKPRGATLGRAEIRGANRVGGRTTLFTGRIVVVGHGRWLVETRDRAGRTLRLPLAVSASSRGYVLTLSVPQARVVLGGFALAIHRVFRNPEALRSYVFRARVVPRALDGSPLPAAAYELQARLNLAAALPLAAGYSSSTHTLRVRGAVRHDQRARAGGDVYIYVSQTKGLPQMTYLATVRTRSGGAFSFATRISPAPRHVYAFSAGGDSRGCRGRITAPGGCLSGTLTGIPSEVVAVRATP